jgi:hypothetical protein
MTKVTLTSRCRQVKRLSQIGLAVLLGWGLAIALTLGLNALHPLDTVLVLGGSIQREVHAARLAKQFPELPILISGGSHPICVQSVFEPVAAPTQQVWLEGCANSTFDNFRFSLRTLRQWRGHKVKLLTSQTHLPRAQWLAQIMLGSHGLWVETEVVAERGVPGNRESFGKTMLDVVRALGWAIASQLHAPSCPKLVHLSSVDRARSSSGLKCERLNSAKSDRSFDWPARRSSRQTS